MNNDNDDIFQYYSGNQEDSRFQKQQLEFLVSQKILNLYLKDQSNLKILELGAGAGFYTEFLASKGHHISVVEPVSSLIEKNKINLKNKNLLSHVDFYNEDARNFDTQDSFDMILNMGPMYHIFDSLERNQLMIKLKKRLKNQGLLMSVFLSRVGFVSYLLSQQPDSLIHDPEGFRDVISIGFNSAHPKNGTFRGYFTNLKELGEIHTQTGLSLSQIHVLDPCIGGSDNLFNQLNENQKIVWSEVLAVLSSDPNFWNTGRTWMAVATQD